MAKILPFKIPAFEVCPSCFAVCSECPSLSDCQRVTSCSRLRDHHRRAASTLEATAAWTCATCEESESCTRPDPCEKIGAVAPGAREHRAGRKGSPPSRDPRPVSEWGPICVRCPEEGECTRPDPCAKLSFLPAGDWDAGA